MKTNYREEQRPEFAHKKPAYDCTPESCSMVAMEKLRAQPDLSMFKGRILRKGRVRNWGNGKLAKRAERGK